MKAMGYKAVFIGVMVITAVWLEFVTSTLWRWFGVYSFGLPRLPFGIAGTTVMILILMFQIINIDNNNNTLNNSIRIMGMVMLGFFAAFVLGFEVRFLVLY